MVGGVSNFSSDPNNFFNTGQIPGSSTDVTLTANTALNFSNMVLGGNFTIHSLTFSDGSTSNVAGLTLNSGVGNNTLTIGSSNGINVNVNAGADTITAGLILGVPQTWSNNSSSPLTISGNVSNGTNTLSVSGGGNTIISGNIGNGSGGLVMSGSSALTLSGSNSFSGGVNFVSGQLNVNSPTALGTVAGTFNISAQRPALDNTTAGPLTLFTNNPITLGGDFVFLGTQNLNLGSGNVTLSGGARTIGVNGGTLTFGGNITGGFDMIKGLASARWY